MSKHIAANVVLQLQFLFLELKKLSETKSARDRKSVDSLIQCPLGLATLGLATILGLSTRNLGVFGRLIYKYNLGFSDLNRVDESWLLNPAGTVFRIHKYPGFSFLCLCEIYVSTTL